MITTGSGVRHDLEGPVTVDIGPSEIWSRSNHCNLPRRCTGATDATSTTDAVEVSRTSRIVYSIPSVRNLARFSGYPLAQAVGAQAIL